MIKPKNHSTPISVRIGFISALIFILGIGLIFRLFQKQISEHQNYLSLAQKQHNIAQEIPARRGKILDCSANILAADLEKYTITAIPRNIKDSSQVSEKLAPLLGMDQKEIKEKITGNALYIPPLKRKVEPEVADKISGLNLPGVMIIPENVRFYPEGNLAGQVLGFVNAQGEGQYGLEGYFNDILKGFVGDIASERDAKGRPINIQKMTKPKEGATIITTLDRNIQFYIEGKLKEGVEKYQADSGSIVIMDVKTGGILAMAGFPNFDPNNFNQVKKEDNWIFQNPVISSAWEPGSIMKPVVMATAMDLGKVEPDTEDVFSNMVTVQGYKIHTAQDKAFGRETMTQVLENSDNVAMVWVSEKMENSQMYQYFENFGFGKKTGIEMDTETPGLLRPLAQWRPVNKATAAFGQGISITPLQMISALGTIANKGKLLKPKIVDKIIYSDGKEEPVTTQEVRQVIKEDTANKIVAMMVSVVERGHGKKAQVEGYKVAGKTGTAQVANPAGGYFTDRSIGSFGGFFPASDPQIVMLVRLDNPKNVEFAESSAAPLFGEIAKWLVNYSKIAPTG